MIPPGSTLGLLGGGQLGRMFTMAAQSMGYRVAVLDPGDDSPAGSVADEHIRADYLEPDGLRRLAATCRAATTEFENVPADALRFLAGHCVVSPAADSVAVAQDRIDEKQFLRQAGFDTAPFAVIRQAADVEVADAALFPGIVKVSRFGYDGKGQASVADAAQALTAWQAMGGEPCVLERRIDLAVEVSVVVVRDFAGRVVTFPVAENHHRHGILDVSIVPARVPDAVAARAREAAVGVAEALDYRGVLCVEFFVDQQARVLAGLPLGDPDLLCPAVMVNVLGEAWAGGEPDWSRVLAHPRAKLHLYGKRDARPGRKMGHFTVLAERREDALATALSIRDELAAAAAPAPRTVGA